MSKSFHRVQASAGEDVNQCLKCFAVLHGIQAMHDHECIQATAASGDAHIVQEVFLDDDKRKDERIMDGPRLVDLWPSCIDCESSLLAVREAERGYCRRCWFRNAVPQMIYDLVNEAANELFKGLEENERRKCLRDFFAELASRQADCIIE